jgi:vitamin B12 transporter
VTIQGSAIEHVRVLVDGMTWNQLASRNALFMTIPVEIIDRIEVVKGPASSSWGSALGGVINIITKPVGYGTHFDGKVSASYGEADSQDYRAAAAGAAGPAGYYLFAGHQQSDGLRADRRFESDALFGKASLAATDIFDLGLSAGYSDPAFDYGTSFDRFGFTVEDHARAFFIQATADLRPTSALSLNVMAYRYEQRFASQTSTLDAPGAPAVDLAEDVTEEETFGINTRLTWRNRVQAVVAGIDSEWGEIDHTAVTGENRQTFHPEEDRWAVYINDTFTLGRWHITPGIRYDNLDTAGDFVSPSLGIVYEPRDGTIFRSIVARGFNAPGLSFTEGGGLYLVPNPDLGPETIWSYQVGVETRAIPYLWAQLSLFHHDVDDLMKFTEDPTTGNILPSNAGDATLQGLELKMETSAYHGVSLLGGFAYFDRDSDDQGKAGNKRYSFNTGARYEYESLQAEMFGRYLWWDDEGADIGSSYDDMIVDLNVTYRPALDIAVAPEIFLTVRNLFDGDQYSGFWTRNPDRWAEVGLRFRF